MSNPSEPEYIARIKNEARQVADGWNEKLTMKTEDLSKLRPFVELFAVVKPETPGGKVTLGEDALGKKGVRINIKSHAKADPEEVEIVPLFNLLIQQTTETATRSGERVLANRGIGGIESLRVEWRNASMNSFAITMEIQIPYLRREIELNRALRKLITQNSRWLIIYGWSKQGFETPKFYDSGGTINLDRSYRGYFKILEAELVRWDVEANANLQTKISCLFMAPAVNLMSSGNVQILRGHIKNLLLFPEKNGLIKNAPDSIKKQLPTDKVYEKFTRTLTVREGVEEQEERGYYYLGWIVEAMRQVLMGEAETKKWESTEYVELVGDGQNQDIVINEKGQKLRHVAKNVGEILLDAKWVEDRLDQTTTTTMQLLQVIVSEAGEKSGLKRLGVISQGNGKILTIQEINERTFTLKGVGEIEVRVGADNSLCQGISFSGQVPRELTYAINAILDTDKGAKTVFSLAKEQYESEKKEGKADEDLSELAKAYINNKTLHPKETVDGSNPEWKEYLRTTVDRGKAMTQIITSNSVPVGFALRNYFTALRLNLHGTAGLPPFSYVDFRGFLDGIDGKYYIFQSTDEIVPGRFFTSVECVLDEPF